MTIMFASYLIICMLTLPQSNTYAQRRKPFATRINPEDVFSNAPNHQKQKRQTQGFQLMPPPGFQKNPENSNFFENPGGFQFNSRDIDNSQRNRENPNFFGNPSGFQSNSRRNSNSRGFTWGDSKMNDDFYVFDAFTTPSTSTVAIPGMETTQSPCEELCRTTFQYNPVCGSNGRTFYNPARLKCAQKCGQKISLNHVGACS